MQEAITYFLSGYTIKIFSIITFYTFLFTPLASYRIVTDLSKILSDFGINFTKEDLKLCRKFIDMLFTALLAVFVLFFLLALVFLEII